MTSSMLAASKLIFGRVMDLSFIKMGEPTLSVEEVETGTFTVWGTGDSQSWSTSRRARARV